MGDLSGELGAALFPSGVLLLADSSALSWEIAIRKSTQDNSKVFVYRTLAAELERNDPNAASN